MRDLCVYKRVRPAVLTLAVMLCLCSTAAEGGDKKMETLYDTKGAATLAPQVFRTGRVNGFALFPVPQDNTVGTNDLDNAITLISFPRGRIAYERHFRNIFDDIGGGGIYLPVIDGDTIGFGQTRVFHLYNFRTRSHREYRIAFSVEKTIIKIATADAARRRFIFELEAMNPRSEDPWDVAFSLHLMDLSGREPKTLKTMPLPISSIWAAAYGRVFLWDFRRGEISVYDMNLEPTRHPLGDAIARNRGSLSFTRLEAHPFLPFAILYGGKYAETILIWGAGRDNSPRALVDNGTHFSFSPDGKWVTFMKKEFSPRRELTYLMPVSERYPYFLGTPIQLAVNSFDIGYFAWTKNPVSFVGSGLRELYRWELTNEAHPESDRATFHDYIVERDLERLARDKKQGLGKEK
ncbi:MAG: hypothetical protein HPY67_02240 [Syntrophaceae bacterium]|nr:hypothetical protein [Syntrophaceae bacterium]